MWTIKVEKRVSKDLKKIDVKNQRRIVDFIEHKLTSLDNPRALGKPLTGRYKGLWRYRVGDYRVVVRIMDEELVILTVRVAHRQGVYE